MVYVARWASAPVRAGEDNLAPTRSRSLERPARSEPLYRLSYPRPQPACPTVNSVVAGLVAFAQKLLFYSAKLGRASLGLSFLHFRLLSSGSVILFAGLFLLFFTGPLLFSSHTTCVFCLPIQLRGSISLWDDAHPVTPDKQSHVLPSTYNTQISWEQTLVSPLSHPVLIKAGNSGVSPLRYVDRWCKVPESNIF